MSAFAPLVGTIGLSMIAGHGLFSDTALAGGTAVMSFDDDVSDIDALGPVNHSCDPNLGWSGTSLVTMRDVAAGAELTTDYALFLDDPTVVVRCHCETYRCRQLVEGDDWRIPQLQTRYAGFWAPRLAALIASA
jgi:hypothetical protein